MDTPCGKSARRREAVKEEMPWTQAAFAERGHLSAVQLTKWAASVHYHYAPYICWMSLWNDNHANCFGNDGSFGRKH